MSATTLTPIGRGERLPDVRGVGPDGTPVRLRDLHYMRHNVALLVVADDARGREWVATAEQLVEAAAAEHGRMVVLSQDAVATSLALIHDAEGQSLTRLGLTAADLPAIFVADRYGQVFTATHGRDAMSELTPDAIPNWLQFVDCRCT